MTGAEGGALSRTVTSFITSPLVLRDRSMASTAARQSAKAALGRKGKCAGTCICSGRCVPLPNCAALEGSHCPLEDEMALDIEGIVDRGAGGKIGRASCRDRVCQYV